MHHTKIDGSGQPGSGEHLLTFAQTCAYLNISESTARRLRHSGKFPQPALPLNRQGRWRKADLDAMLTRPAKGGGS
jgi:predicted DNA-binding transcriptional regulator AlpA